MPAIGDIRISISGWNYPPWRGVFYPAKLAHKKELAYAASQFRSIEINGTFYSLQRPEYFAEWDRATPEDFVFAIKGSRYITHMLRLLEVRPALANFFASGVLRLGREDGSGAVAISVEFQIRIGTSREFLQAIAAGHGISSAIGAAARQASQRASVDANGREPADTTRNRNTAREFCYAGIR